MENNKNKNYQDINLEEISAGANLGSKVFSGVLAPILALSGINASADNTNKTSIINSGKFESINSLKNKFTNFKKEHPKIFKAGIATGATIAGGIGLTTIAKTGLKIYLRDINTIVDNMSKDELNKFLDDQIKEFEGRNGGKVFKIDEKLKKTNNKKCLALSVLSINNAFKKFPKYADYIAKYSPNHVFKFGIVPESFMKSILTYGVPIIAYADRNAGIYVSNIAISFKDLTMAQGKHLVKSGKRSDLKLSEIVQGAISHELGHVFEYCLYQFGSAEDIKQIIIKEAKRIDPNFDNFKISEYGEINCYEWFAEVFSNLMNGAESTPLTKAMENYLNSHMNNLL